MAQREPSRGDLPGRAAKPAPEPPDPQGLAPLGPPGTPLQPRRPRDNRNGCPTEQIAAFAAHPPLPASAPAADLRAVPCPRRADAHTDHPPGHLNSSATPTLAPPPPGPAL